MKKAEEHTSSAFLLEYLFHQSEEAVWHISERKIYPCARGDDRSRVTECLEAFLRMVTAHAGIPYAAERHIFIGDMHDHIIDASSSGRCPADDFPSVGFLSEIVESQRLFT